MNDRDLMAIHADTLFSHDARGRMLRSNETEARPAPRLFLGCTTNGFVVRFGEAVPDAMVQELTEIIERQPARGDLHVPVAVRSALRKVLDRRTPVRSEGGGPAYRFPESIVQPVKTVQLTERNIELVRDTYPWLEHELASWQPCFAVVRDAAAVSVCFSSRIGATACEAGVETLPAFRRQGYAAAVTAAWGACLRDTGRIPLYSTWWDNLASQRVARRVGLIMFGADSTWE